MRLKKIKDTKELLKVRPEMVILVENNLIKKPTVELTEKEKKLKEFVDKLKG